jgi:2,3-bisphosphoglycerate-dependent phosphoglycerate mutase
MTTPERLRELAAASDPRAGLTNLFFVTPGEGVTDLLLIRHAQIDATTQMDDLHLTDIGREQAEVLAQHLSHGKLDAVYASPTARARETAEPIARIHTLEIGIIEDLRDVEQLKPFDKPLPELLEEEFGAEEAPKVLERMRKEMTFDTMAPFLESSASFRSRVNGAVEGIIARHPGERVAVLTHAPVIMAYVATLLQSPWDFPMNPRLTSITRVLAKDGRRTLDYINATPHLDER